MSVDSLIKHLDSHREVSEFYILVREVNLYLDIGHSYFSPRVGIKVWKSNVLSDEFHFTVSHNVHTPSQAAPYYPSRTSASTEIAAINSAIDSITSFLKNAISSGHEPEYEWMIPNEDY